MGRSVADAVLDAALNHLKNNGNKLVICEGEPTSYALANTAKGSGGYKLAEYTLAGSDYTLANGDTSGRKVTVGAKSGNNVSVSGDADHVAIIDTVSSALLYVTPCTLQTLTAGNPVNTAAFLYELRDPVAA